MKRSADGLRPTLWDIPVYLTVLLLAAVCTALLWRNAGSGALTAVISTDGSETERVVLSDLREPETRTYHSHGYTLQVACSADGVQVTESDCPNGDCMRTGRISRSGESIVCLPARISIQLTGGADSGGIDAVLR